MDSSVLSGIVADGRERFSSTEQFLEREHKARLAVEAAFAPRLAAAHGLFEHLLLLRERRRELRRVLRELGPSPSACFLSAP